MAHELEIPQQFKEVLEENNQMQMLVLSAIDEFGTWLERNKLKFFSEYTDHSLRHVEGVLKTADTLIRDECRSYITSQDVATLVLAVLLHDCAMHLSKDGFVVLIKGDDGSTVIPGFGDKPWSKLWEDFIAEARRFSGRKLMALFGDIEPVRIPPLEEPDRINERDLLLIGEFLRRHHYRLAHEIALSGVPGPHEDRLKLESKDETRHIIDLAGLVARSHGLPLRSCLEYVKHNYGTYKTQRRVHAPFLMTLLRIADILQVQSDRAPQQIPKVEILHSPVSEGEWEMHQAIKYINRDEYPETIFIEVKPENVRTYLRIKGLLIQIQQELDEAWTVIGEVYSYDKKFQEFGLTIRRVRSNLDDEEAFAQQVEYVPCHAAFDVADSDLLKLLIGPLYGESPQIGIRELMQNSLDAVRELEEYRKIHPELKDIELTEQEGDVVISIDQEEDDSWWVTVSDRGIGMTVDTVINYFLKAGASLRRSELWRETFEDEEGKSRVLRSGRFGVGVLAAYLLGEEISVATRHVTAPEGIEFSTKLDAEYIELKRIKRPVGTIIRVKISNEVKDALYGAFEIEIGGRELRMEDEWDWYCLTSPTVVRKFCGTQLKPLYALPSHEKLPPHWYRIIHPDYADIHWTFSNAPALTCNGILIKRYSRGSLFREYYEIKCPAISIFDFNAKLPLNLQRDALTESNFPFKEELIDDVLKDMLAHILVNAPTFLINKPSFFSQFANYIVRKPNILGPERILRFLSLWFTAESGFSFALDSWHIQELHSKNILLLTSFLKGSHDSNILPDDVTNISHPIFYSWFKVSSDTRKPKKSEVINEAISFNIRGERGYNKVYDYKREYQILRNLTIPGKRILISRHTLQQLENLREHQEHLTFEPLAEEFMSLVQEEWSNEDWVLWQIGECPPAIFDFEKFAEENPGDQTDIWLGILAEWYMKEEQPEVELSPLARVWRDVLGTPIIPFDLQERRRVLAKAYEELQPYIEAHEIMKREGYEKFGLKKLVDDE